MVEFFSPVLFEFNLFGFTVEITRTVTVTWLVMAILIVFSVYGGKKFDRVPRGLQNFVELIVEGIVWLVDNTMGKERRGFVPFIGALTLYLFVANLIGLLPFRPPTADLSTTLGLALVTFACTQYYGIKEKGFGKYLKGFIEPLPIMLPMNIIGEVANPFSMAFRLFGNIVGGSVIVMGLVYSAFPYLIPVPLHAYFDIFAGILQTFIFAMLTMTFISMAMD